MGLLGKLKGMLDTRKNTSTEVEDDEPIDEIDEDFDGYYEPEDLDSPPDYLFLKALHAAAKGDLDTIRRYLEFQENYVLCKDWEENTLLHRAAQFARAEVVAVLLDGGAEINKLCKHKSPLHLAVATTALWAKTNKKETTPEQHAAEQLRTVKLLLERGADTNLADNEGETALHIAAKTGNVALVQLLIEQGSDINRLTQAGTDNAPATGRTPLLLAARHTKSKRMLHYLLQHGAAPNQRDADPGYGALHYIAITPPFNDDPKKEQFLADLAKLLLQAGADPNLSTPQKQNQTALHFAARQNHVALAKTLLNFKADPLKLTDKGLSPMGIAARSGFQAFVSVLLDAGVSIEKSNALFYAALCRKSTQVLELLLERGADINHPDEQGFTPIFAAVSANSLTNVKFLLDHGVDLKLHPPGLTLSQHAFANWGAIEAKGEKANAQEKEAAKAIISLLGGFD